ncbi:MAG: helix-turn-helix domain-containing protein [Myxococcota bacterium]
MPNPPSGAAAKRDRGLPRPPPVRTFRQERARVSYEKLLGSAARLLLERGPTATQVPEIAAGAGLSVGAFYHYFTDKRAVFVELLHRFLEKQNQIQADYLDTWRERILSGEATGRDFLESVIEFASAQQDFPPELLRSVIAMTHNDAEMSALRRAYDECDRPDLARFFAAVTTRERIPSPLAAARVFDIAAEEIVRWAQLEGGRPARDARAALVEMLDRYLFAGD